MLVCAPEQPFLTQAPRFLPPRAPRAVTSPIDWTKPWVVPVSIPYCGADRIGIRFRRLLPGRHSRRDGVPRFRSASIRSVAGMDVDSVMHNVANGYNALSAFATGNAELARQQIISRTLWWGFIYSYLLGATDRSHDQVDLEVSLPRFIPIT